MRGYRAFCGKWSFLLLAFRKYFCMPSAFFALQSGRMRRPSMLCGTFLKRQRNADSRIYAKMSKKTRMPESTLAFCNIFPHSITDATKNVVRNGCTAAFTALNNVLWICQQKEKSIYIY